LSGHHESRSQRPFPFHPFASNHLQFLAVAPFHTAAALPSPPAMNRQSSAAMSAHQRLEAFTDLSMLSQLSDDIIVACLRERFMSDHIYTNIGSSGLVALNPHKYVPSNADSILHKYATEYRDTSEHKELLPPHIFQLANNAYYHMRRTIQDQSIVFR
jgi:chitin synthase